MRLEKCKFFQNQIVYLGHEISRDGIRPKKTSMKAIFDAPSPSDVTTLKSYLGLLNFYSKFIPNLSGRLAPLYNLLRKDSKFVWSNECESTFIQSKNWLYDSNLLVHYDPQKPIGIVCDSSSYGVGAVLFHVIDGVESPIMFTSCSLSSAEKGYSQLHREALAVIFAVKKFHKFIFGHQFVIYTDHQPLEQIFGIKNTTAIASARLQRWIIILSQYDKTVKYRKGSRVANADALSRLPLNEPSEIGGDSINFFNITGNFLLDNKTISVETKNDEILSKVYNYINSSWPYSIREPQLLNFYNRRLELSIQDNCILMGSRIVIPNKLRLQILELLHEGHIGMVRMKIEARSIVYWFNIDKDIENFVRTCDICAQTSSIKPSPIPLTSWPGTTYPFERVHIDFFHFGRENFLIVFDVFSKWMDVILMTKTNASQVISVLRKIMSTFGLFTNMVSDNGPPFNSSEVHKFCTVNGINFMHSPPYHPQSNGSAEKSVSIAKSSLKRFLLSEQTKGLPIQSKLDNFLFRYRNAPTSVTGVSPASLIFQYDIKTKLKLLRSNNSNPENLTKIHEKKNNNNQPVCVKNILRNSNLVQSKKPINCNKNLESVDYCFKNGENIWYIIPNKNIVNKIPGIIEKRLSKVLYLVNLRGARRTAHGEQLRKRIIKKVKFSPTVRIVDCESKPEDTAFDSNDKIDASCSGSSDSFFDTHSQSSELDSDDSIASSPDNEDQLVLRRSKRKIKKPELYTGYT